MSSRKVTYGAPKAGVWQKITGNSRAIWEADVVPRADKHASNPFLTFKDIPVKARYQFLLDDAQYHVMTFIKGPVCKGQTALNSIDEQFYVHVLGS